MTRVPVFGIDISHHQGGFDVERAAREGIDFFIFKATEGSGFVDARFAENIAKARKTGKPFAAYHYQRGDVSAAAQVAHITSVVPKDVAVIPDVEAGSGTTALTRDIVAHLRQAGYRVPLLYLPRWYWQQIGSPSLEGLPPLWSSRYPDNKIGDIHEEYDDILTRYWDGYGGLPVSVLQFTSSARVAGRAPIDGNAYRGSLADLGELFTGAPGGGGSAPGNDPIERHYQLNEEDRAMQLEPGKRAYGTTIPGGAKKVVLNFPDGRAADVRIQWIGPKYPTTTGKWPGGDDYPDADWVTDDWTQDGVRRMRPMNIPIPQKGAGVEDTPVALRLAYDWDPETDTTVYGSLDFK